MNKKQKIPKNITKQNIDMFNQALGTLTEDAKTKAWMIRNDGKEFQVQVHPYGNPDDYEETLAASEWLYSHANSAEIKNLIIEFIATWVMDECYMQHDTIAEQLYDEIDDRNYVFLTKNFVDSIKDKLERADTNEDLDDLNKAINSALNNEFMRVRAGGEVNSDASLGELYFRISSDNFNWFNIIWNFVYSRQKSTDTVTIKRDREATGSDKYYSHNGKVFDRMPVDEFIMLKGNPIVENLKQDLLDYGYDEYDYQEACKALRDEFNSDYDFLMEYLEGIQNTVRYNTFLYYLEDDFNIHSIDDITDEIATQIVDDNLYEMAPDVDTPFINQYVKWIYGGELPVDE